MKENYFWIIVGIALGLAIYLADKYLFDLSVEAPQYLSPGTLILPILSNSVLYFIYDSFIIHPILIYINYNRRNNE